MSTQQKYINMPNEMALELIRNFLQPGMPTLGMWFGWNQPSYNDHVKLGTAWGTSEDYVSAQEVLDGATFEEKKEYVRFLKAHGKHRTHEIRLKGLFCAEEVFFPYNQMDIEHQMLYRLMVMSINTCGLPYHEWSVEFGEMLAEWYADKKAAKCDWELYDPDGKDEEMVKEFLDQFGHLITFDVDISQRDIYPEGIVDKHVSDEVVEWLDEYIENFNGDFYHWMFQVQSNEYTYWHDEVDKVLAWFIEWMQDEWKSGNLTLTPETPSDKLNEWLKWVESQPVLPIFEEPAE